MGDVKVFHNLFQGELCIIVDVSILHFHDVFTCEVVYLSCFILQQENLTSDMKSSEVYLWKSFYLTKSKGYYKVLSFESKSSQLGTNVKYNRNNKVKQFVIIHVCNDFDM